MAAFPEFAPGRKKVLFFSRGRGRGHAAPDLAIIAALEAICPEADVRSVTYATGAKVFEQAGRPYVDLGLPDEGSIADMSVLAGKLIGWLNPDLVVSHEEFAAAPAAKIFDIPVVFFTDWFAGSETFAMNALTFADRILFLGSRGIFDEPLSLAGKVRYMGALIRRREDRTTLCRQGRAEWGIPAGALVTGVFPGSWSEAVTPVMEAVTAAFGALAAPTRRLLWVAGADYELVSARMASRNQAIVIEHTARIAQAMAACDVAITKTNRKAVYELRHLGVPVVAVSFGVNPADDRAVRALDSVVVLAGDQLNGRTLAAHLARLAACPPPREPFACCSPEDCARQIAVALDGL